MKKFKNSPLSKKFMLEENIKKFLENHEKPRRVALSVRFPLLRPIIIFIKKFAKKISLFLDARTRFSYSDKYFSCVVARHQSVLRRKLGDSSPRLQEQKIINIRKAIKKFDGVIIAPGQVFSFWKILGEVSYKNGYVDGMLISRGKVIE